MRHLSVIIWFFLIISCGTNQGASSLTGLGATANGKNVATLFGSPNGLGGVPTDIRELNKLFLDPQYNFKFTTATNDKARVNDILNLTKQEAKTADTLLWYFSGHGNDGIMSAEDAFFTFGDVADAIIKSRQSVPLKRLLVFIDSCYSGSFVNGSAPIVTEPSDEGDSQSEDDGDISDNDDERQAQIAFRNWVEQTVFKPIAEAYNKKLYEQAFVMASSKKDETSADNGEEYGGAFTYSLRTSFATIKKQNPKATFKDLAKMTISTTQEEGGHTPVYKSFPISTMINDKLFIYGN